MRSTLYVPGDQPDKLHKALARGADGVICDLEDAIAPSAKLAARATVANFLADHNTDGVDGLPAILVRINWGEAGLVDLRALIPAGGAKLAAIYVPKVSTVDEIHQVHRELADLETSVGLEVGALGIVALLETAQGILNAPAIAQAPRVRRLAIGEADLGAELGVELTPGDEREMLASRSMLVLASAAAGIDPPVGPVSTDFRDLDALRASSEALRRLGFRGRSCIHPSQVAIVNDVFTPTLAQLEKAERLVALYDTAVAFGEGVIADDNGKMIDEAVVRSARRTVAQRALILGGV